MWRDSDGVRDQESRGRPGGKVIASAPESRRGPDAGLQSSADASWLLSPPYASGKQDKPTRKLPIRNRRRHGLEGRAGMAVNVTETGS